MERLTRLLDAAFPPKAPATQNPTSALLLSPYDIMQNLGMESTLARVAGLSGALAISLGAYGAHALREVENVDERRMRAFQAGNRYHLLHSVALLSASKARFPLLTASLFLGGMMAFSGICYHYSITGNACLRRYAPIGGIMYILAWLTFVL